MAGDSAGGQVAPFEMMHACITCMPTNSKALAGWRPDQVEAIRAGEKQQRKSGTGGDLRRIPRTAIGLSLGVLAAVIPAVADKRDKSDLEARAQKAREVATSLADRLRQELTQALKSGVAAAVSQCQTISPDLNAASSEQGGFEVQRTSLKLRNPENAPDDWERSVLLQFQDKVAAGSEVGKLEFFEVVVTPEGDKLFRFMRAIVTGEQCLACHGTEIKQDVRAELTRYYPDDKATGYKLGDLRGAFSLVQLIEE